MNGPSRRAPVVTALLALVLLCHALALFTLWRQPHALTASAEELAFQVLGLFYLVSGAMTWWRCPRDRASGPLLLLCLAVALHTLIAAPDGGVGSALQRVSRGSALFIGPAGVLLAAAFTGASQHRVSRLLSAAALVVALALAGAASVLGVTTGAPHWLRWSGVALFGLCLVAATWIVLRVGSQSSPAIFGYRARALGGAAALALLPPFIVDSGVLGWLGSPPGLIPTVLLEVTPLALLPVVLALVIARITPKDIADLILRRRAGQLASATAQAATALSAVRTLEETAAALHRIAVDGWSATLAHLVVLESEPSPRLRRVYPAKVNLDPPGDAYPVPERFAPRELKPVARALEQGILVTAWDPESVVAQSQAPENGADRRDEAHFWTHYGIEAILPIQRGDQTLGLLLLGPRRGGRPLHGGVVLQLPLLANLIAAAMERVDLLRQLARQAEGLEQRIAQHTRELSGTRSSLETVHRQLLEVEMQAMLGRLVAGIVHEMNTPLGTLASSVDTLRRAAQRYRPYVVSAAEADPDAARALKAIDAQEQLVEVIDSSQRRLSEISARLARFVALDAAEIKDVDVCQSLDDVLTLAAPDLGQQITIDRSYPDQHPVVRCAPARLSQVFLNLIENAADAVDETGEIRITVSSEEKHVVVEIRDTGRGIPAGKLDGILEFAFTVKTDQRVGLRTGLPACRKSVVEMGGRLSINSKEGEGTTVVVTLPAAS